ncbi:hypothetical protein GO755_32825 [Spirosoma sp. HMF4905]|uniref:Uncharacterized protein n=1 Tax=Spirosoma arboris TaxID=2682092 RepID=A0A7K1SM32_9BACT|nr:hypothetical protein [Spirosoma arboris]MVM34859.1 hypothetical protein [Spirosoma arboris]
MHRTATQPTQKKRKLLNNLGRAYSDAKRSKQLAYQSALLEAGENDNANYWRSFRDVWQYAESIGKAPFIIVALAEEILSAKILNPLTK